MRRIWPALLLGLSGAALSDRGADTSQTPARDAAEIVQEGDVSQWLQHYQRERGAEWSKQQREQPAQTPPEGRTEPPATQP